MRTLFKHLERLLFLAFLLVVGEGKAQNVFMEDLGYSAADTSTLGQKYANNPSACAVDYPQFMLELQRRGLEPQWAKVRLIDAAIRELQWKHDDYINVTYTPNGNGCKAVIVVPHGEFKHNYPIISHQGQIIGGGTQGFYDTNRNASGGTTLIMDWRNWVGPPGDTAVFFKDWNWGRRSLLAYNEGSQIRGFKLMGEKPNLFDPTTRLVVGMEVWTAGENFTRRDFFIYNCDIGVLLGGQYHATYTDYDMSIFGCNLAAYRIAGGGHLQCYNPSMDNNPWCYDFQPDPVTGNFGNGAMLKTFGGKCESGQADGPARVNDKAQGFVNVEGGYSQIKVNDMMLSHNEKSCPEVFARLKGNWRIKADLLYFTGPPYRTMVHDRNTKTKKLFTPIAGDGIAPVEQEFKGDYTGRWFSYGDPAPTVVSNACDDRLGPIKRNADGTLAGTWDDANCKPPYSLTTSMNGSTGGTTPTCTAWIAPDWANIPCINGTKTGTAGKSPAGCTGTPPGTKPAESQTCTVTPPPSGSWTTLWTGTTVSSTTCKDGFSVTATKVRLTNWTPSALNYGRIVGTGSNKNSLQLWPDGYLYFGNTKCVTDLPGKIVAGTKYASVTVTIPTAVLTTAWQTNCGQGGACPGTCEKLEAQ